MLIVLSRSKFLFHSTVQSNVYTFSSGKQLLFAFYTDDCSIELIDTFLLLIAFNLFVPNKYSLIYVVGEERCDREIVIKF